MRSRSLLPPVRFRFVDESDIARFGDGWFAYDESAIVRLPARRLVALEAAIGLPLAQAMTDFADDKVMGRLAVTWIGVHLADPNLAGDFDKYEPAVFLINIEFGPVPAEPQEDVAAPLDQPPSESSPGSPIVG